MDTTTIIGIVITAACVIAAIVIGIIWVRQEYAPFKQQAST